MPGFDGTGPMGMGAMTGGARGQCKPNYQLSGPVGFRPGQGRGGGRGRGYRNMYWATGLPGWRRSNQAGFRAVPSEAPFAGEQELDFLKNQATALKAELDTINARLKEIESRGERSV